jgi:hypothetical protein
MSDRQAQEQPKARLTLRADVSPAEETERTTSSRLRIPALDISLAPDPAAYGANWLCPLRELR